VIQQMRSCLSAVAEAEQVLARWSDDGWYYQGMRIHIHLRCGPAKVRPSYISLVVTSSLECVDKSQSFFGKCDNCVTRHTLWKG